MRTKSVYFSLHLQLILGRVSFHSLFDGIATGGHMHASTKGGLDASGHELKSNDGVATTMHGSL